MKYVITGSSGFIGSHLQRKFPKRNIITIPHSKLYNMTELANLIPEDTLYIYHCASYGNMANHKEFDLIVKANVLTTHNLLMATQNIDYKALVYLSSSSVYGEKDHPMHETNSLEPLDYYGCSKVATEYLIRAFVENTEKPVVIARPFSVYGQGEAEYRFIPTVIRSIQTGEKMKLAHGMHDWVYIEDFIDGLMYIQEVAKEYKGKAINVGTGQQNDNYDVVKILSDITGVSFESLDIEHIDHMRTKNSWVADNTLLRSIGWSVKHSLREGLVRTYEYYNRARA